MYSAEVSQHLNFQAGRKCSTSSRIACHVQSKSEVQAFFGLPDSEELLEKFQCTLVQSYACTNNHFTTPRLVCS